MTALRLILARHGRTVLGAAVGAVGGAAYAHFVGCHTGTCAITSNVWIAAAFFGFTGAVVGLPGPSREPAPPPPPAPQRSSPIP